MPHNWSIQEVTLIIQDYFHMLESELQGIPYSKAEHRRKLLPRLKNRSEASIEFKHQNISAVLIRYNLPYIPGYKPRFNYQQLLEDAVFEYLKHAPHLFNLFEKFAFEKPQKFPPVVNYDRIQKEPPPASGFLSDEENTPPYSRPVLRKPNYLLIEQQNRALGELGEELIVNYEKWRLIKSGKEKLSEQVEWISKEQGDGAGFDILSKNSNGTDRYIEVKTTKLGEQVPIYFSRNELEFSRKNPDHFYLYRVYNFYKDPRCFIRNGSFDSFCKMEAVNFVGKF